MYSKASVPKEGKRTTLISLQDEKGYIRITDLGIARIYKINNSSDTSGTPGYMCIYIFI